MSDLHRIAGLVRSALGTAESLGSPYLIGEQSAVMLDDGIALRDYQVCLRSGEVCCVSVASPAIQKFPCPVIAAHQTNLSGRKEVFGLADNAAYDYGLMMARRGHKVYCIDLRWAGERRQSAFWDFNGFRDAHPAWSPLGADCRDFEDLIFLMRFVFGEKLPFTWIGHSHGAVNGLFLAACQPAGTFAGVACNAGFAGFADSSAVERQIYLERYFNRLASHDVLLALDGVIALVCEKTRLRLTCYRDDEVMMYPLPTEAQAAKLDRIGPGLELAVVDGQHSFPSHMQFNAALFLERPPGFASGNTGRYSRWLGAHRAGAGPVGAVKVDTQRRLRLQTFGGIGINSTEHGCSILSTLISAGLPPAFVMVSAETDEQLALSAPYFDRTDWLMAVADSGLRAVAGQHTLARLACAAGIPTLFVPGLSSDTAVALARATQVDAILLLETPVLRGNILQAAPAGLINFHAAPLPCYRGSNATLWALYHDEPLEVWAHFVEAGVDTGDLICSLPLPVLRSDDLPTLATRACEVSAQLAVQLIRQAQGEGVIITVQDGRRAQRFRGAMPAEVIDACRKRLAQGQYSFYVAH